MLDWLISWLRRKLGHWLLADEEAEERRREQERARKQQEIIDAHFETTDAADDLDAGRF
mgnify:CR=1 FL=1